jgi:hypothetical protein
VTERNFLLYCIAVVLTWVPSDARTAVLAGHRAHLAALPADVKSSNIA